MSTLTFRPPRVEIGSTETVPLEFEMVDLLANGESVQTPVVTLTNLATGVSYPAGLSGSASIVGTRIRQSFTALAAGQHYRAVVSMTPVSGKTLSAELLIDCPF